jgi:hypothetical protein
MKRRPSLIGSLGLSFRYKSYLFCLVFSSWPNSIYFFPHRLHYFYSYVPIAQQAGQAAVLGRLSLTVCLCSLSLCINLSESALKRPILVKIPCPCLSILGKVVRSNGLMFMFCLKLFKFARPAMHANYFKSSTLHRLGTSTYIVQCTTPRTFQDKSSVNQFLECPLSGSYTTIFIIVASFLVTLRKGRA